MRIFVRLATCLVLTGCAASPPVDFPELPPGFRAGEAADFAGPIRPTRPVTLVRDFAVRLVVAPADARGAGQPARLDLDLSWTSQASIVPGREIRADFAQRDVAAKVLVEGAPDRRIAALPRGASFGSAATWDAACRSPREGALRSAGIAPPPDGNDLLWSFMRQMDVIAFECFADGVRAGTETTAPARSVLRGEALGRVMGAVNGSVRMKVAAMGMFEGREAFAVLLAGNLGIGEGPTPGAIRGRVVVDAKEGLILSHEIMFQIPAVNIAGVSHRVAGGWQMRADGVR